MRIDLFFQAQCRDRFMISLGVFLAVLESLAEPASIVIVSKVFKSLEQLIRGEIQPDKFMFQVSQYSIALAVVAGYVFVCGFLTYAVWVDLGYQLGHQARKTLFKVLVNKRIEWFDSTEYVTGRMMTLFKDIQDVEVATGIVACELISISVGLIAHLSIAFYYSWAVTLVSLAGIPLVALLGALSPKISSLLESQKKIQDQANSRCAWVLESLQTVNIFQKEREELRIFSDKITANSKIAVKYWSLFNLQQGLARFIILSMFVQSFYFGSYMVRHHGLSSGAVIAVFWSCLSAASSFQAMIEHFIEWQRGSVAAVRLQEAFSENSSQNLHDSIGIVPKGETEGSIEFNNVVFSYPSRPELILACTTLSFEPHKMTFILGGSGSGKSTIASLISRQYHADAGEISIDGHSIELLSYQWIQQNVYVVEQNPQIFDMSLAENISIASPHPVSEREIEEALLDVYADDFISSLPNGLETDALSGLSGGQQQRINLARARISNAPVMVFDESTSAVDPKLQAEIMSNLCVWREGKTTIVITHDTSIIPRECPIWAIDYGEAIKYSSRETLPRHLTTNRTRSTVNSLQPGLADEKTELKYSIIAVNSGPASVSSSLDRETHRNYKESETTVSLKDCFSSSVLLFASVQDKLIFVLGIFMVAFHAAINPIFAFVFSKLIMGILNPDARNVTLWAIMVLVCAFMDGATTVSKTLINISAERCISSIRVSLYDLLLEQRKLSAKQASSFTSLIINDTEKCILIIATYWPGIATMVVLCVVGLVWSFIQGARLTLVALSLIPAFMTLSQLYKYSNSHWNTRRELERSRVTHLVSNITDGFRTLKTVGLEKYFGRRFDKLEHDLMNTSRQMCYWTGIIYGVVKVFPYALESLLIWYSMHLIATLQYTVQNAMTIFSLLMFTMITVDQVTTSIGNVGPGFAMIRKVHNERQNLKRERMRSHLHGNAVTPYDWRKLSFCDVGIEYNNQKTVLRHLNLSIEPGTTVALLGPSGIGKSAIARMLERFEDPSEGRILVDGCDLLSIPIWEARDHIAMVGQMPLDFFDGTIMENLLYCLNESLTRNSAQAELLIQEFCSSCGIVDFIVELENGFDTVLTNQSLSGGQMQRLGIVRALLRKPEILILDECTSALDPENQKKVYKLIRDLKSKGDTTILLITHQHSFASVADNIVRLA